MPDWKLFSISFRPRIPRAARPLPRTALRLEGLEDRTVMSTLNVEPLQFLAAPEAISLTVGERNLPATTTTNKANYASASGGLGLESLLEAVQSLERLLDQALVVGTDVSRSGQGDASDNTPVSSSGSDGLSAPEPPQSTTEASPGVPAAPELAAPPGTTVANAEMPGIELTGLRQQQGSQSATEQETPSLARGQTITGAPAPYRARETDTDRAREPGEMPTDATADVVNGVRPEQSLADWLDEPASDDVGGPVLQTSPVRPREAVREPAISESAGLVDASAELDQIAARVPDGVLLQRFAVHGDETAFAALVQRYDRFVLRVCERVLGDAHAAQDACQGTFFILARKASILSWQNPLGGWLARVAYRLALRLRAIADRQRRSERECASGPLPEDAADFGAAVDKREILQALGEELQRLPEKYRTPLVLCYFDGQTHEQAARALGLLRGSMAKRIGEGLQRLRDRLLARGFTP